MEKTFRIIFNKDYFAKEDVIIAAANQEIEIVSDVWEKYGRWYYKILYYLTFKRLFVQRFEYIVKLVEDDKNT